MDNVFIDILPIVLLVITLIGIKPIRPLSGINREYLSVDTGKCYRGLFAVVVVLHHISQRTQTGMAFHAFYYMGSLAVAVFFFLSGYGLQKSYMVKQEKYRKKFLARRLPTVLFPYIAVTAIYWVMYYYTDGISYSFKDVITAIVKGSPIVSNSWYIINILLFYAVFWLLMCICKKNYRSMIILSCMWYPVYALFCIKMGYGSWWYTSTPVLIIGMFWAVYEEKIIDVINNHNSIIPLTWGLFAVSFLFQNKLKIFIPSYGTELIFSVVTVSLFAVSVVLFSVKFRFGNKILAFLGSISLEIYLIHGLFIKVLRSDKLYIRNELIWAVLVVGASVAAGYILHIFFSAVISKYKNSLR